MEKSKRYRRTRFSADVLASAISEFRTAVTGGQDAEPIQLAVELADATWNHDSEAAFLADYRSSNGEAAIHLLGKSMRTCQMVINARNIEIYGDTIVSVKAIDRPEIERVFLVFERHAEGSRLPEPPEPPPPPVKIFIGHGGSRLWRELNDHLRDLHGFEVEAYEVGARAGHAVRDILETMLTNSSMAFLVMTGEDETADDNLRARQNVVHELGLFQGKLGFPRAIALVEEGTELFTNMAGIQQVRFSKGNIKETFGEVVATIRREVG